MHSRENPKLNPQLAQRIAEDCYGEVLAYCRRHAPEGFEPADLAQETFLRFVRVQGYAERGKPIAYLMRVARSVCVDASRKRRLETVPLDFDVAIAETDETQKVWSSLERLPDDLREVVEMRFGAGLQVNEVAKALGVSRFSARRKINKALELLGQEIEEEEPAYGSQEESETQDRAVKQLRRT